MEVTLPVALLMSAAATLSGIAGTWALLRYKVERATASATAAHRRLDALEPIVTRHQVLHEEHEKRLAEALEHLRQDIHGLGEKIDAMYERELERARTKAQ